MNSNSVFSGVRYIVAFIGGGIAFWLGGLDQLLIALMALMALDYITGLLSAAAQKKVSSQAGFRGITKKILLLSVVAVAFIIEEITGGGLPLREMTIMFFLANEGLSVMENAAKLGLPLPKRLEDVLAQLHGKDHNSNVENNSSETDSAD